jgi:hypothetical protein
MPDMSPERSRLSIDIDWILFVAVPTAATISVIAPQIVAIEVAFSLAGDCEVICATLESK